ncbi:hypothetical protein Tco_0401350 [Tanacetum coccineum]
MYAFKECSSCGALYNKDHCCSVDTFVRDPNETPDSSKQSLPNCPTCGDPVDGLYCRPCAFQEEKRIAEEQVPKARYWKIPICNDDDEEYTIAITPILPTVEPDNSLSMGDEHLSTIPKTESDELIKSSDENLVPIPSESEDFSDIESECDVPDCDDSQTTNFSTFSNPLFDDSTSSDDESSHEEVIHEISFKTYSNPLFDLDEEIISSEFNPIHNEDLDSTPKNDRFDTESYLLESLLNRDTLMASSPKIDSLFDEFAGKLITIPPRIVNREHEEYISLLERLLYDNSSPRPPEDFHANPNTIIESLPTFSIPVEDSNNLREEIDIFPGPDDSIPPAIESDDYDSEGDDNSTSLLEFKSFHVDYPDSGYSTIDVVEDIPIDVPNILPTHPTLHMDPILMFLLLPEIETRFTIRGYALKSNPRDFLLLFPLIARIFEASRAYGFVLRSLELQILSFIMGIQYSNLID